MAIETRLMMVDKAKSTGTYQYYFVSGNTFYSSTGEKSGVDVFAELIPDKYNGQKVPVIKVQYPSYKPVDEAEQTLRNELALAGYFKNSISYPKTGTSIPPEDNPYSSTESTPETTTPTDTIVNTSKTPIYSYSDGTTVTFELLGPKKTAVITYGSTFGEDDFEIIKGNTDQGTPSFAASFDILAEERIISYNNSRENYLLPPVTLVEIIPPVPPPPPVPFEYSITGKVIDSITNEPLTNTKIKISGKEGQEVPNSTGDFTLTGETTNENRITLTFNANNYTTKTVTPYTGNGQIKSDIGIIGLQPNVKSIESDKITASQLSTDEIKNLSSDSKDLAGVIQKRLSGTVADLKNNFIPTILVILAKFGVTGVPEIIEQAKSGASGASKIAGQAKSGASGASEIAGQAKSGAPGTSEIAGQAKSLLPTDQILCPARDVLLDIIEKKNRLVKKLNITYKTIDSTTNAIGISEDTISILLGTFQGLDAALLAAPSAVAGVGLPIGVIDKGIKEKDNVKDKADTLKNRVKSLSPVLSLVASTLSKAISYLNLLDSLVQNCADEAGLEDDTTQTQIAEELNNLTLAEANQQSPVVTNINGFKMDIETEKTTNSLKRKRAIARNKQGIVMLKGEYSYSSIDQILIDELVFYIQQNDLKAD